MLIPTALIVFLWLAWFSVRTARKIKHSRRKLQQRQRTQDLVSKANEIFALAELTEKQMVIHRGLPGYCLMTVHADFQARLAERGKSAIGNPDFERIERALEWWLPRETYMMAFSQNELLSFHHGHLDWAEKDRDLMPVTQKREHVTIAIKALDAFYTYLDLPASLNEARLPKADIVRVPQPAPLPLREPREYDVTPANKIDHIVEYVKDGDPRTFYDMFYGDLDHEFVMWVDHRESDDDIIKMCARALKMDALDGWFDNDTLDLIVHYRGVPHAIKYPNEFADRDTTIIGLNKIIQPEFELRYCTASDGNDTAAIMPLTAMEWDAVEMQCGRMLKRFFTPIDEDFSKLSA